MKIVKNDKEIKRDFNIFVISDTHFCHENIIKYCDRPFKNVHEMNNYMIQKWNSVVGKHDLVIHCGDVVLGPNDVAEKVLKQLNGRKYLIKGNHDNKSDTFYRKCGFERISDFPIIIDGKYIFAHAPLEKLGDSDLFLYYGHVHNDMDYGDTKNSKCVCVERLDYTPLLVIKKDEE